MKISAVLLLFISFVSYAQPNTEVYLMDIAQSDKSIEISNFKNISTTEGYDSQPFFISNDKLVYAGTENGQTEIQLYYLESGGKHRLNAPTTGGEYSPQKFPSSNLIAAVRLDTTGLQRLYAYDQTIPGYGKWKMLFDELEVAYFAFHDDDRIIASVLSDNQLDLHVGTISKDESKLYIANAGRSIHKVPSSNSVSYTLYNEDKNLDVYILDIDDTAESFYVCELPIGIQDHIWLSDSKLLIGSGSKLFQYDLYGEGEWKQVADLSSYDIDNITRMSVSPDGKHLAIVADIKSLTPSEIVQAHIEPFNSRNLEAFSDAFSENVIVSRFPVDTIHVGKKALKENYKRFYKNNKNASVSVKNRIEFQNIVIDEEEANNNGRLNRQATIYETGNEKITSMTFVSNQKTKEDPTTIIDQQLTAYNNRDIDSFMATYSDAIEIANFPNVITSKGQKTMKESFESFFKNTPNLHCEIKNRIVIGNKVIDHEYVTMNNSFISAIAIYEVENGLIKKVTFIQ